MDRRLKVNLCICFLVCVCSIFTSAGHLASNDAVACAVKAFKNMLYAHVIAHPQHWVQSLPVMRSHAVLVSWHAASGMSPQQMVFGRQPHPALPLSSDVLLAAAQTGGQVPCRLYLVVSVVLLLLRFPVQTWCTLAAAAARARCRGS
jgi:hypothetical protein